MNYIRLFFSIFGTALIVIGAFMSGDLYARYLIDLEECGSEVCITFVNGFTGFFMLLHIMIIIAGLMIAFAIPDLSPFNSKRPEQE